MPECLCRVTASSLACVQTDFYQGNDLMLITDDEGDNVPGPIVFVSVRGD